MTNDARDARELFERAQFAAQALERRTAELERMKAAETGGGSGDGIKTSHGSISDPMRKVDARMTIESVWKREMEEDKATIDYATAVLYGEDGRTGLSRCIGSGYADLLWLRYLDSRSVKGLSQIYQCGRTTIYRKLEIALDFIDANGFKATMRGTNNVT